MDQNNYILLLVFIISFSGVDFSSLRDPIDHICIFLTSIPWFVLQMKENSSFYLPPLMKGWFYVNDLISPSIWSRKLLYQYHKFYCAGWRRLIQARFDSGHHFWAREDWHPKKHFPVKNKPVSVTKRLLFTSKLA